MPRHSFTLLERRCSKCNKHKPIAGGTMTPKFICADCKKRIKPKPQIL